MEIKNIDYKIDEEMSERKENMWYVYEREKRKIYEVANSFFDYEIRHKNLVDGLRI